MIGHQVSYTWRSFWQQTEVVSSPLRTLGTSSSGFTSCHVFMSKKERAALPLLVLVKECKRILSADLSGHCRGYWAVLVLLQKVHSCQASCQSVANKRPADPSVTPSAGSLFPLWCWWLVQLSGGLVLDAFISPSCQSSVTTTLLLLLIITIIIVWWQRCAEHLGRLWCRFPCRWGEAVQFSTLMWHSGI